MKPTKNIPVGKSITFVSDGLVKGHEVARILVNEIVSNGTVHQEQIFNVCISDPQVRAPVEEYERNKVVKNYLDPFGNALRGTTVQWHGRPHFKCCSSCFNKEIYFGFRSL